ncbi:uncharacterized protein BP5553_06877 [Venustampulla echinocandica]|uniref:FAD-binding PCMH-type domain-containing protein n=1 Tax=Venustampulla echinocandica TaxID=2656787 RepID=A0A370TL69_9HELO|nr:uncharacterized protein BP5553_06877 [Venustampulla echinocandica]RDL36265.1 hypothetical protein BP5553_06877 [Venustampulla echinocandica]
MATLDSLKQALREKAKATASSPKQPLSATQYSAGFNILMRGSGWITYQDFIIPQLSQLLALLFNSRIHISALEIGPGPKSILGYLPGRLKRKVRKYTAFEPNGLFATRLEEWLYSTSETESPLPCLENPPNIHRIPFVLQNIGSGTSTGTGNNDEKYDIILFCHSMYGMKPKHRFIERALEMLVERPQGGIVAVFHRDALHLDGLVCHRTASFPTGVVSVADDDEVLDCFAPFVAGFIMQAVDVDKAIRVKWRKVCRALGRREETHPDHLLFSSPNVMAAFTQHAITLPELMAQVPLAKGDKIVKNREARLHRPASIIRPTKVRHVQQCVRWALKHGVGLTVVGGGHSGHCLWPNVISVDMGAFDQVHILTAGEEDERKSDSNSSSLVVAEGGCKTGDIVTKTMAAGLTVPLGARPSVGAGLWLQGGIGHLARLHGFACDAIVGAVVISVDSGQVFCVGCVPSQHWPVGAVRPENETDLLWAMKGAGTNFGIVISITFKAYAAPTYSIRNWVVPLSDSLEAQLKLSDFDELVASKLSRNFSADAYLYWDNDQLHLGVAMFESSTSRQTFETPTPTPTPIGTVLGLEDNFKVVDSVGLFDTEMYMSGMYGENGGGKTSSFKRCLFLKRIGAVNVADILVAAVGTRPSPLCYLHLLQGGGAVGDVAADATAFGCRDWDFACVVTGVWPRDQDGTEAARTAVQWVYNVAGDLLPLSSGAYGADLGPDPRDAALAAEAFGPNRPRLARLKHSLDPHNVLAYACPLLKAPMEQKLIILITGESCAGKDYCADVWVSVFTRCTRKSLTARAVSISEATKREYAAATDADLNRLLWDRAYKEQHRPALTTFFQGQARQRSRLPEEHFLNVVYSAADVDVLLITGMRDEAPVAALSHLVPDSRLLEIRVKASEETRQVRRGCYGSNNNSDNKDSNNSGSNLTALDYRPSLIFDNDTTGNEAVKRFAEHYLLHFVHEDLQRLAHIVRQVPNFPCPGIDFRHVLGISQQPGGLALCTSLLQTHFTGDWAKVDAVACCEAGGFVYASALASRVNVPLVLIREAGKLPPPTVSVIKLSSHISSLASNNSKEKRIEMERDVVSRGSSVVVVDDVLSTGETLCAVLQLLDEAGISAEDVSIIVVAEFPVQRGRDLLRQRGFGRINIQSLLMFGGA